MGSRIVRDRTRELWPDRQFRQTDDLDEYLQYLKMKIFEEAAELCLAVGRTEIAEEAADLAEVLTAYLDSHDITVHEMEVHRAAKFTERGGFTKGLIWEY